MKWMVIINYESKLYYRGCHFWNEVADRVDGYVVHVCYLQ